MLERDDFFEAIDNLVICEKDYDTALKLMDALPTKLFVKILEEILEGNLFWEDFEPYLSQSNEYTESLKMSLEQQAKLVKDITNLTIFRENINASMENANQFNFKTQQMGLVPPAQDASNGDKELYDTEAENYSLGMIYSAIKIRPDDTLVEKEFKTKLFNAIENGLIVKKNNLAVNEDGTVRENNTNYNYILPSELFFSADRLIIPIQYEYQVLNEADKEYMAANGLTENEMKKLKAASEVLKLGGANG